MSETTTVRRTTLTRQNFPIAKVTPAVIPAKNEWPERRGFKVFGFWLNGSENFDTREACYNALLGNHITTAQSGKSVVCEEWITQDTDGIMTVLSQRVTDPAEVNSVNLNDLF